MFRKETFYFQMFDRVL